MDNKCRIIEKFGHLILYCDKKSSSVKAVEDFFIACKEVDRQRLTKKRECV